jgi:RNA polymerase sigma-70 factor (ECF subfamily)
MRADSGLVSDEALIKLIVNGNKQAFGVLYERYLDAIYRYIIYQVGGNHQEAEDLTEEVFFRAFKMVLKKTKKRSNFRALLYRIAHNLVVDRYRTHKLELHLDQIKEMTDKLPTPEIWSQSLEKSKELAAAISELHPKMRKVIILRFIVGLSNSETAEVMGISKGNVRVIQYRALKAMKMKI